MAEEDIYYADYLQLDKLLSAQQPLSDNSGVQAHDEMFFIIIHQVYELWFKQLLVEIDSVRFLLQEKTLADEMISTVVSRLQRMADIQQVMIEQIKVLESMSPMDFLEFRHLLASSSGFQSHQFRLLEIKLGVKFSSMVVFASLSQSHQKLIEQANDEASLFTLIEQWLQRCPYAQPESEVFWQQYRNAVDGLMIKEIERIQSHDHLKKEQTKIRIKQVKQSHDQFAALFDEKKFAKLKKENKVRMSLTATKAALFIYLYRDKVDLQMPYRLLSTLLDLDEYFANWRYRHALMVQRMIGNKVGTGGSSGCQYLYESSNERRVFSDLINLVNFLLPRSELP